MVEKFVLITGPTSGIGLELANIYAKKRMNLLLVSRNEEKLIQLQQEFSKRVTVRIFVADLSTQKGLNSFCKYLEQEQISVKVLINNSGFGLYGSFREQSIEQLQEMLSLNIRALITITHACLPSILKNKGKILQVSSIAGFLPGPYMSVYYASKAFVNSFSRALRKEVQSKGVVVSLLCPGPTATNFGIRASANAVYLKKGLMSAKTVALAGVRGLEYNKAVIIPGFKNKCIVWLTAVVPVSVQVYLLARLQQKHH